MKLILFAIAALAAFVAVWVFVVVPAERRHHERKLEILRKRIEERNGRNRSPAFDSIEDPDER